MKKTIILSIVLFLFTVSTVLAADHLSVSSTPGTLSVDDGSIVESTYTLLNTGTTDLNVTVQPILMSYSGFSFTLTGTPSVPENFMSGTSQVINISGLVPDNQFAGTYTGIVNTSGGTASASFTLSIDVKDDAHISASGTSLTIVSGNTGTGSIGVSNTGNMDISILFQANNLVKTSNAARFIPASQISFSPSTLALAYGGSGATIVSVAVPAGTENGTYTGNATLFYDGKQEEVTLTVYVQDPLKEITVTPTALSIEDRPGDDFSSTFTVKNSGTEDLIDLTSTVTGFSGWNISLSPVTFDLSAGASQVITVKGEFEDDIDTTQNPFKGTATISNNDVTQSVELSLYGKVMVEFNRVDVYVNNKRERVDNGDTVDNINPGDTIRIKGELENLWPDRKDEDFEIQDIEVTITVSDIDDGDDIDEDLDVDDINAGDKDTFELEFTVPYNTDEDTYDLQIEVVAEDENGAKYDLDLQATLDVERESHKLKITEASLDRTVVSCDRNVRLQAEVTNIGSKVERNVVLEAKSTTLQIQEQETDIKLSDDPDDDDNQYFQTFFIEIPDSKRAGTYRINVNAYLDRTDLDDTEILTLEVQDCGNTVPEVPDEPDESNQADKPNTPDEPNEPNTGDNDVVIVTPPVVSPPTGGQVIVPTEKQSSFTESTGFIVLLAVILVLVFIAVVAMVVLLLKK